jgi:steroid delta-isomerase-like uncharacterized protein
MRRRLRMKKLGMILPLALILCFMVGCQDKEAMAELEKFKAQAAVEEQNKELVKRHIEELNKGNIEIFKEVFSPECGFYYPSNRSKPISLEQNMAGIKMGFKAFPDFNQRIEELFAVGDRVIARLIATGTHEGDFPGIPATGKKIEYSAIIIVRIENGIIVEERIEADILGFYQKLGMELKPKKGEK